MGIKDKVKKVATRKYEIIELAKHMLFLNPLLTGICHNVNKRRKRRLRVREPLEFLTYTPGYYFFYEVYSAI